MATKYIGEYEAASAEEAEQMAWNSDEAYISVCRHCSYEVEDPEIDRMEVEEVSHAQRDQ